ncbi:MAG: nucleoside monophosphate kinase [bacterium]|nr:nucleoside monophosphate kinase [bacterium]
MAKIAVIMYGPPGSGKGTQANLLAERLGLVHLDTGRFLETLVHDPANKNNKTIQGEKKLFDTGFLMTPSFALSEISKRAKVIAKEGEGIILSGSPRTLFEVTGLIPVLEKLYGKKRIHIFELRIKEPISVKRNSNRVVCSICRAPLLTAYYPSKNPRHCPICAGPFYKRTLDNKETMKIRLNEYRKRTEPVLGYLKERRYKVNQVNGELPPFMVFKKIYGHFKNTRRD